MTSTRTAILQMPRLNANEDEAKIVALPKGEGAQFQKGELLFSVETTKAANDIEAPCKGRVTRVLVALEDMIEVGAAICEVEVEHGEDLAEIDFVWAEGAEEAKDEASSGPPRVSTKARQVARDLGIDIDEVESRGGRVRVEDVERHAAKVRVRRSAEIADLPALQDSYAADDAVVFGGSGHARAVIDMAQDSGLNLIGAVDDKVAPGSAVTGDIVVLGAADLLETLRERGLRKAVVGVGGATSNAIRKQIFDKLTALGFELPSIVSRSAHLGIGSTLGPASYLFPGASVGPEVTIGANCIINQNVVVAHDSRIEDDVHLAPNAVIAGHCTVREGATIGMCSTLIYGATVGRGCLVHNNVPVTSDLADGTILTLRDVVRRMSDPS